jgi:anti-anti-sigma factor
MDITVKKAGEISVMGFEGNLDTATVAEAEGEINRVLEEGGNQVLINFENLNYISSAGLRILLATAKKLKTSGGNLVICSLNETVQEVFDISGFSSILSVASNEDEALGAF